MSSLVPRVYQTVGSAVLRSKAANGIGGSGETYGRVLDVVMDSSHPQYNNLGKSQALYGVFYQKLYKNNDISRPDRDLNFAYCGHANVRKIPVKNEIVSLISDIRADTSEEYGKIKSERVYWKDIIPVWNSPHANLYPDTVSAKTINSKYFVEQGDIRPLKMCEGDLAVEGRFGNTIRLGGHVDVETKIDKGSIFKIKLPLTLAIIQALLVKVQEEMYAIPLGSIDSTINIMPTDIKTVQNREVIVLRGQIIPIVRLNEMFSVPHVKDREEEDIYVVVVHVGERKVGIVVDDLVGQQEIVIKTLGKLLSSLKMFSGATVLGDGRVALILDVGTLMQ